MRGGRFLGEARVGVVAGLVCAAVALTLSCSSKSDSAGLLGDEGDGGLLVRAPAGSSAGSGASDAGVGLLGDTGDASALCASAQQLGAPTEQLEQPGTSFAPSGGTVSPGTYTLSGLYSYLGGDAGADAGGDESTPEPDSGEVLSGGGPTGYEEEKTLVLQAGGLFSLISASGTVDPGVGASAIVGGTYAVSGTTITLRASCPLSGATTTTYAFSASGGTLALYEPTGGAVDVFQLQP